MPLNVTLELPPEVEAKIRSESTNLDRDVRDAYALELFRLGKISHYELARILGLDRFETDAWLKLHGVFARSLGMTDLDADLQALEQVLGRVR
jgi:predicted HTH domain antitoxin